MILHPRLDRLRAFADGELGPRTRRRTAAHLARCTRCRETVAWVRSVKAAVRPATDLPAPEGAWDRIADRVRAGGVMLLPVDGPTPAPVRPRIPVLRAAALVIGLAGAASAMVPGSPVRVWIENALSGAGPEEPPATVPDTSSSEPTTEETPEAVLLVPLAEGPLVISVEDVAPGLGIRVRLADTDEVEVRASGDVAAARFRTGPGRLAVAGGAAGDVAFTLPRAAGRITIEVAGSPYLTAEHGRLSVHAPLAEVTASEIVLISP